MSNLTETDLHAYADGQLDDARRVQVERIWRTTWPRPRACASARAKRSAARALQPVLNEPVPQRLLRAGAGPALAVLRDRCGAMGLASDWAGRYIPTKAIGRST